MEHVVFYPAEDGSPAFRRLDNLEEAVRLVEHLRNSDGVGEASVHSLTEVPLSFRAYYRVEVPGLSVEVPVVTPEPEVVEVSGSDERAVPAEPEPVQLVPAAIPVQEHVASAPEPETAQGPSPVTSLLVEQPTAVQQDDLVRVGAPEEPAPALTGSPFSTDRSLGFFA